MYWNLDLVAIAISGRRMGFREPQMMAPFPRFANIVVRNRFPVGNADQLGRDQGRYLADCPSVDGVRKAAEAAAHLESALQMAAHRINALDAKLTDARRAMRAGFLARSSFAIYPQPHPLFAPKVDRLSSRASGPAVIKQREESGIPMPAAAGGGGASVAQRANKVLRTKYAPFPF